MLVLSLEKILTMLVFCIYKNPRVTHVSDRTVSSGEYCPLSDELGPDEATLDRKGSAETGPNSSSATTLQEILQGHMYTLLNAAL